MAILVVFERGVGARPGNIRSRKNTKCFADYSRAGHRRLNVGIGVLKHDRTAKVILDLGNDRLFISRPCYIPTKSILSTTHTEFLISSLRHFSRTRDRGNTGTP